MNDEHERYDVIVVGGGPAGLNGALMLARSRRRVLVVDAGNPRNRPADAMHGFLGHDGLPPAQLLQRGREEVRSYGGETVDAEVVGAEREGNGFIIHLSGGARVTARRLLVTTGVVDELPDVPGVRALWGHDVLHCPYCHGWEVRDKAIGVLASGPRSVHQALLFRQLSADVVYFTHTLPPEVDEREKIAAVGIALIEGRVASLEVENEHLAAVRLTDDRRIERDVLVLATRLIASAPFLTDLGLEPTEHPTGLGEHIPVDPTGRTAVPGVWAAGNVTDPAAQVGSSAAAGAMAAAQINADLVDEDARRAVEASRRERKTNAI